MNIRTLVLGATVGLSAVSGVVSADEVTDRLHIFYQQRIQAWATDSRIVDAIKAQNAAHASLNQADIDRLDREWRGQTKSGSGPLIDSVLGNSLSAYLKQVKQSGAGIYTEIFVMDNKGLNVGQSDVTSDYWQGDETKWRATYLGGSKSIHVGEVELDESTQTYQSQVSATIVDPATGGAIGAITVGVDVEQILQ